MTEILNFMAINLSGKVGNKVYGITKGRQWVRTHVIPNNPQSVNQTNNRVAFALVNALFKALDSTDKNLWILESRKRVLVKSNFFVKRGMKEFIKQLGVSIPPTSVQIIGIYPSDGWTWI